MPFFSSRHKAGLYKVSRATRRGEHHYSVLAWNEGFTLLFPSGMTRWSTIGNHHNERLLEVHSKEIARRARTRRPFDCDDYLRIACGLGGSWVFTDPISYPSRDEAIEAEVAVLDAEMARRPDPRWRGNANRPILKDSNMKVAAGSRSLLPKIINEPASYSTEPLEKELGLQDLAEAIIEWIHFAPHHDNDYLKKRIELLCTWIGLEFSWELSNRETGLTSLEDLLRGEHQLSKGVLPFDAFIYLEGPGDRPEDLAYFAVRKKMQHEYSVVQPLILQIHRAYVLSLLLNLTSLQDQESSFTLEDLVLDGLPRNEVVGDWGDY